MSEQEMVLLTAMREELCGGTLRDNIRATQAAPEHTEFLNSQGTAA